MKTLFVAILLLSFTSWGLTPPSRLINGKLAVSSPIEFARTQSKLFALGDNGDASGYMGCKESSPDVDQVVIRCNGYRVAVQPSGYEVNMRFSCLFRFHRLTGSTQFLVDSFDCQ